MISLVIGLEVIDCPIKDSFGVKYPGVVGRRAGLWYGGRSSLHRGHRLGHWPLLQSYHLE